MSTYTIVMLAISILALAVDIAMLVITILNFKTKK